MKNLLQYFVQSARPGLTELTRAEYAERLVNLEEGMARAAFEKAWATRNFEIELYWKRATYFWAFIASAFVGYFGLVNATGYRTADRYAHAEVFAVSCLGFLLSLAWLLTNIGSKQWQRHWEVHVDLLEDRFTGPLYKTVNPSVTYSVSKINEIVSVAVVLVWILLAFKYLADQSLLHVCGQPNVFVVSTTIGTLALSVAMLFGRGRGRFSERHVRMYARSVRFADGPAQRSNETPEAPPVTKS